MILSGYSTSTAQPAGMPDPGISVTVKAANGEYVITSSDPNWTFTGSIGKPLSSISRTSGFDRFGSYKQIAFAWTGDNEYTGYIRWYTREPVVLFGLTVPKGAKKIGTVFPDFKSFPQHLNHYSFANRAFAPPRFKLVQSSTPWLFFNDRDEAFIVSPATDFIVSKMTGDGMHTISSGLNPQLQNLPVNFTHKTILVVGNGIHHDWTVWGNALMAMHGKNRPANDADPALKYYGYWTDNGADYYYNYDKPLGYGGTLQKIRETYKKDGIPIRYMQLDSWWYEKSIYNPDGQPTAGHKNRKLAVSDWNNYGGLMEYRADKKVFPNGLAGFQHNVGLPIIVHNRWIDPHSPYHKEYNITGFAAIDPHFWDHIMSFLKHAGIFDYEQDWLVTIYNHTPKMASDLFVGNEFTDGMANAAFDHGLDMQYCMAMPRFFMQGVKYGNLTTIRTSDDRFDLPKWHDFVYTSQLAYTLGIWPWCDVFKSHETGNMIVSVLSAGAVGTGDALGKADKHNIMLASRKDGILVKPDASLVPVDQDYINEANNAHMPMLGFTYTKHHAVKTYYVLAFKPDKQSSNSISFKPASIGARGDVVVYDPMTKSVKKMMSDQSIDIDLGDSSYTYYEIAPILPSGIAFLGDEGKIVETGRQRISNMTDIGNRMKITVDFASKESAVTLHGYYEKPIRSDTGKLSLDPATNMFTLVVHAPSSGHKTTVTLSAE